MYRWVDVCTCARVYVGLHASVHACMCDALLRFSSIHFHSFYSKLLETLDNKNMCRWVGVCVCAGCVCMYACLRDGSLRFSSIHFSYKKYIQLCTYLNEIPGLFCFYPC